MIFRFAEQGCSLESNEMLVPNALFIALCLYAVCSLVSMATMSIGAGIVALAWGIHSRFSTRALRELAQGERRPFAKASSALAFAVCLSLLSAVLYPYVVAGKTARIDWGHSLGKLWYLFFPLLLSSALLSVTPPQRRVIFNFWIGTFFVLSIFGVFQFFLGFGAPPIPAVEGRFHPVLFQGHHLSVASIWIFPLFAALDSAWASNSPRARSATLFYGLAAFVGALVLFLTWARSVWFALPVGFLIWFWLRLPRAQRLVGLIAVAVGAAWALTRDQFWHRLLTGGIFERVELWKANLTFFLDRPITGVGFRLNSELSHFFLSEKTGSENVFSSHAHNQLLDTASTLGIVGLIAWCAWMGIALRAGFRARSRGYVWATGWLCAMVVFLLNGLTQSNFWEGKVLHQISWTVAWMIVGATLGKRSDA